MYMYIYIYTCIYVYIYIYIEKEGLDEWVNVNSDTREEDTGNREDVELTDEVYIYAYSQSYMCK
jgi:hypothetical protein